MNKKYDMSKYRIKRAKELFEVAKFVIDIDTKTAANRSYYSVFEAMRAVLALDNFDSKKHSGVISEFQRKYIKTNIFPKEFSKIITRLFDIRNDSDYEDFFVISKEDVQNQINSAEIFIYEIEKYLIKCWVCEED